MMDRSKGRLSPTIAHVRRLDGEFFLCTEVADALGVSPATLRRLAGRNPGGLGPTHISELATRELALYDMARVSDLAQETSRTVRGARRGRPRLWDDAERRSRRRAYSAMGYQRRRARVLDARGDCVAAAEAVDRAANLGAATAEQFEERQLDQRSKRPSSEGGGR